MLLEPAVSPTNNVRTNGETSRTDDGQQRNVMCGRTRPGFDDSGRKNRTDDPCTSHLTNIHCKDE